MKTHRFTLETLAYLLAFGLALLVRLVGLGNLPLTEREAELALQAVSIARGAPVALDAQPGYLVLTSLLFALFHPSNGLARLWPALIGSLLVGGPLLFRRQLGRWPALILAFGLALDPGLVSISRSANGMIFALSGGVLAVGFLFHRRPILAGIFGGLAILSGPDLWPGVVALGVAAFLYRLLSPRADKTGGADAPARKGRAMQMPFILAALTLVAVGFVLVETGYLFLSAGFWLAGWYASRAGAPPEDPGEDLFRPVGFAWRTALIALLLTILVAGTGFLRAPVGLSAMGESVVEYARGFSQPSGVSAMRMLIALIVYQPIALLFGLWRVIANLLRRNRLDAFLSIAWFLSLGLALIPAGREVNGLAWALLPLWALAARQIASILDRSISENWMPALAQMVLQFVLLVFVVQNVLALNNDLTSMVESPQIRLVAIGGALILMILTAVMMGIGWSWRAAGGGTVLGLGLALGLYTLSTMVSAAGFARTDAHELYRFGSAPRDAALLVGTVEDLGLFSRGGRELLDIVVVDVRSASMAWALRDVDSLEFVNVLPAGIQPAVVITKSQVTLAIEGEYRGQDFYWTQEPAWEAFTLSEWIGWWFHRKEPQSLTNVILWARGDLFFGGASSSSTQP